MIELTLVEQDLMANLLWEYGCATSSDRSFDSYLNRCLNGRLRQHLLAQLLRSEMWCERRSTKWLSAQLAQVGSKVLRHRLIRDVYQDLLQRDKSPAWSEFQIFGSADVLDLREEGDPVYLGQLLATDLLVERRLGAGTFAVVYEARDHNDLRFAIKILRPEFVRPDSAIRRDFLKEALKTASLPEISGLPRLIDIRLLDESPTPLLVSLYHLKKGETLSHWKIHVLEELTPRRCANIVQSIAELLSVMHGRGLYHRDLSTSNILLDDVGEVHLLDLGLSLAEHECRRRVRFAGTRRFSAPENLSGERFAGPLSDVFSLGAVLQELIERVPCPSEMQAGANQQFAELAVIAARACDPVPKSRFESALEMASELAAWTSGRLSYSVQLTIGASVAQSDLGNTSKIHEAATFLSGLADPDRDPNDASGLSRTMQTNLSEALGIAERISGIRCGAVSVDRTDTVTQDDDLELARLLWLLASHLRIQGEWRRFLVFAERALEIGERHGMPQTDPYQYSIWLDDFAASLINHGRTTEAINAARRCLQLRLTHCSSDQLFVHQGHNNLGECLRLAGQIRPAQWHLQRFRQFVRKAIGPDDNEYGWALSNKCELLLGKHDATAAIFVGRNALRIKEDALGDDHVQLCFVLNKLGRAASKLKSFDEADQYFHRALRLREEHYGRGNPVSVETARLWADSWKDRGEDSQAMKMCEEILEHFPFGEINLHVSKVLELCVQISSGSKAKQYELWLEGVTAYQAEATDDRLDAIGRDGSDETRPKK